MLNWFFLDHVRLHYQNKNFMTQMGQNIVYLVDLLILLEQDHYSDTIQAFYRVRFSRNIFPIIQYIG